MHSSRLQIFALNISTTRLLRHGCLFLTLILALAAFLPTAQAVLPPPAPDGGYPGFNTAEGEDALFSLTTGSGNTAIGQQALALTTTGSLNTAIGRNALRNNTTGGSNTAAGGIALFENSGGSNNTATGYSALFFNDASNNTAVGYFALSFNVSGEGNTAIGVSALEQNKVSNNTAIGFQALFSNTTGSNNTADGVNALHSNKNGSFNNADGVNALSSNTTGSRNTASGYATLASNTSGSFNIAVGNQAGVNLTTGNNNIDIGAPGAAGEANTIRIGKQGTQKATFIAGIFGTAVTGSTVVVTSGGKLGVATSSARFKEAIKPMDKASEAILNLKPVTFRYKEDIDPDGIPQFGLVAEEVEKVNPDLVVRDEDGKVTPCAMKR